MTPLTPVQEAEYSRYGMYPFNWIIEGKLLASVYPNVSYLRYLRVHEGVTLAVNLTASPWDRGWSSRSGIRCIQIPVVDMMTPSVAGAKRIMRSIDSNEGATMVHCAAGIGRTGTIAAIYLVDKGMEPEKAIRTVRQRRPGSIQTHAQEMMVKNWNRIEE